MLDGTDREGNPILSEGEDDGEEGEGEFDEETLAKLKEHGFVVGEDDDDDEEGEVDYGLDDDEDPSYGDEEGDDDEESEEPVQKRKK